MRPKFIMFLFLLSLPCLSFAGDDDDSGTGNPTGTESESGSNSNQGNNQGGDTSNESTLVPTGRPQSDPDRPHAPSNCIIYVHADGFGLWFDYDSDVLGSLYVTVTETSTCLQVASGYISCDGDCLPLLLKSGRTYYIQASTIQGQSLAGYLHTY